MSRLIRNARWVGIIVGVLVFQFCLPTTVWADDEFDISGGEAVAIIAVALAAGVAYLGVSIRGYKAASRSQRGGRSGPMKTWRIAGGSAFALMFIAVKDDYTGIVESSAAGLPWLSQSPDSQAFFTTLSFERRMTVRNRTKRSSTSGKMQNQLGSLCFGMIREHEPARGFLNSGGTQDGQSNFYP